MSKQHKLARVALGCALMAGALSSATAAEQKICVYDIVGTSGDVYNLAKDYAVAMQKAGATITLKAYTDERVATEDFRTGQCDGVIATGLRTRQFNALAGSIDSLGSTTIIRNGNVDMGASYEVVRKVIETFTSPKAGKLMVEGNYEVGGIVPMGAAFPIVNDRKINSVEALAGKRIAAFDHDKAQAAMIQRIGAQPVSADVTNFGTKFNNGSVDMIAAPALAYKPLELYKGIGTKGAMAEFPVMILTYQVILNKTKFPDGFGEKSREYWLSQFDRAMKLVKSAEGAIPKSAWNNLAPDANVKYTLMLRESRIALAEQGFYNKQGLKIIKRVRCSVNPADSECSNQAELDWK